MKKIAIFPGSFDPITRGHQDIVLRALPLFDQIIIAIGMNSQKSYLIPLEDRIRFIRETFQNQPNIIVDSYEGLTVNYCLAKGASYIIRGIRQASDFDYEKTIAHLNNAMAPELETILFPSKPELSSISSTIVREIIRGGGDVSKFVPEGIVEAVKKLSKA